MRKVWEKILFAVREESTGGILLLLAAVVALVLANSAVSATFLGLWHFHFAGLSLHHWINDGLMAIFFFAVGLEIRHELHDGALSSVKKATLPAVAALGGMVIPASIYLLFPHSAEGMRGWAVPMATDIAFVAGILSLLGKRVPAAAKIFVISLAVVDDIGAVLVIAVVFTSALSTPFIVGALGVLGLLGILRKRGAHHLAIYLIGGTLLWWFTLKSGIHATVAGVLLAAVIPANQVPRLEAKLKPLNAFFVMPLFALANAGVNLEGAAVATEVLVAVIAGLFVGKPLGIYAFSRLAVKLKLAELPRSVSWTHVLGVGCLGGIGFTMALFMGQLALTSEGAISGAKVGILTASALSIVAGTVVLLVSKKFSVKSSG